MTTSTNSGEADTSELGGIESATDAFLASFKLPADAEEPSEEETRKKPTTESEHSEPEETSEEHEDTPSDKEESEGEEETEQKPAKKSFVESDDVFVKVKVGDQELEVPVKDLKRLHGQEAALTRRSQEVAAERKAVQDKGLQYGAKLDRMIQTVTARANEYRKLDFIALAKDQHITADQLRALQDEARQVFEEEAFLKGELKNVSETVQKEQQETMINRAKECVKTVQDQASPFHIEGFDQKSYNSLKEFALKSGIDEATVNGIVDAPILKLLHMAYLYAQTKTGAKVPTKVVTKTAKKIVKTSNTPPSKASTTSQKAKDAMKSLKAKGSVDAATDAFLARWETEE